MSVLSGLSVVEVASEVAGPYTTKLLADLGAGVTKVEPPGGDPARRIGPFAGNEPGEDRSVLFLHCNTSKRSVRIDLEHPEGAELLRRLVRGADVLVTDRRPEELAALGIDFEGLASETPSLVVLSFTPFGWDGPNAHHAATPLTTFHSAGEGYLTPVASHLMPEVVNRPPVRQGRFAAQYKLATYTGTLVLAAVFAARATGCGQVIELSEQDALIGLNFFEFQGYLELGLTPTRASLAVPFGGIMRCADGYLQFTFHEEHQSARPGKGHGRPGVGARRVGVHGAVTPRPSRRDQRPVGGVAVHQEQRRGSGGRPGHGGDRRPLPLGGRGSPVRTDGGARLSGAHRASGCRERQLSDRTVALLRRGAHSRPGARTGRAHPGGSLRSRTDPRPAGRPCGRWNDLRPATQGEEEKVIHANRKGALAGVRILDFTWAVAGPTATMTAATLGAEVIKVETRLRLDVLRRSGFTSATTNRQKKAITLNLRHPRAVELAKRLVTVSDAVAESFRPGVMDSLGLGYEALRAVKADIIMLSSSMAGQHGPYARFAGYAPMFVALSGLGEMTGYADGPPTQIRVGGDIIVGVHGGFALLAALVHHQATGEGVHIDLSSIESQSNLIGDSILEHTLNGTAPSRAGNDEPGLVPHDCFRCRGDDQWVAIGVGTDSQWQGLVAAMGRPDWAKDPDLDTPEGRWAARHAVGERVNEWTSTRSPGEVTAALQAQGVPSAPSFRAPELFADPHVTSRDLLATVPGEGREWRLLRLGGRLPITPLQLDRAGPAMGESNEEVFKGLLGLSDEEITELEADGVFT